MIHIDATSNPPFLRTGTVTLNHGGTNLAVYTSTEFDVLHDGDVVARRATLDVAAGFPER